MSAPETAQMLADAGYEPANGAQSPDGGLGNKLREVARLMKNDVGLQVACIDQGGFDTAATCSRRSTTDRCSASG